MGGVELGGRGYDRPAGMHGVGFPTMGSGGQGSGAAQAVGPAAAAYAVPPGDAHITWADEGGKPLAEVFYSNNLHYSTDWRMEEGEHGSVCCAVM